MSRELVTLTWCDVHQADKDESVPAQPFTWEGRDLDLCDECAAQVLAVQRLFADYGRKADGKPVRNSRGDDPQTCTVCGMVAKNQASLGSHVRGQHGMTVAEYRGEDGIRCEECQRVFANPQGLAVHQRRSH